MNYEIDYEIESDTDLFTVVSNIDIFGTISIDKLRMLFSIYP